MLPLKLYYAAIMLQLKDYYAAIILLLICIAIMLIVYCYYNIYIKVEIGMYVLGAW